MKLLKLSLQIVFQQPASWNSCGARVLVARRPSIRVERVFSSYCKACIGRERR